MMQHSAPRAGRTDSQTSASYSRLEGRKTWTGIFLLTLRSIRMLRRVGGM